MKIRQYSIEELLGNGRDFDFFAPSCTGERKKAAGMLAGTGLYELPVTDKGMVVWGFCVLEALYEKGFREIFCRDISGESYSLLEKLNQALVIENRKGGYSWPEKERIYRFIAEKLGGECPEETLSLVQDGGSFLPSAAQFASLTGVLRELTAENRVDLKTADNCRNIPDEALRVLEPYLLSLSFSKRRIMLTDISEIIRGTLHDNSQVKELALKIASDNDPAAAAGRLRRPGLAETAAAFDDFCASLPKKSVIQLKAPENFEGEYFTAGFSFRSRKQLDRIIGAMTEIRDRCDELFRLL